MLRLSLVPTLPTRPVLCVLCILISPTIGQIAFNVAAQAHLNAGNTKQEIAFVSSPKGEPQVANGLSVFLPKSVKYKVFVVFQSTAGNDKEKETDRFRRVRIYKPAKANTDCLKRECWKKVVQLSNSREDLDSDLDSKISKVLVTSWTPPSTSTRMAIPDEYKEVVSATMVSQEKGTMKGVKITFTCSVGLTLVTIIPR